MGDLRVDSDFKSRGQCCLSGLLQNRESLSSYQVVEFLAVAVRIDNGLIGPWVDLVVDDFGPVPKNDNEPASYAVVVQRSNVAATDSHVSPRVIE